jgi:hypothetical protein
MVLNWGAHENHEKFACYANFLGIARGNVCVLRKLFISAESAAAHIQSTREADRAFLMRSMRPMEYLDPLRVSNRIKSGFNPHHA